MKSDSNSNEIKIKDILIIYLISILITVIATGFILAKSDGEITGSDVNNLSLLTAIFLLGMLIYRIRPTKEKINFLYKDFKSKVNVKEIIWIILFIACLNLGGIKLLTDVIYFINKSFSTEYLNDFPLTINSMMDYWVCFLILVVLSPIIDEITFRFILFKQLSKKFNIYVGLIVSSIIFSALNFCPQIVGTLALGIINCIVYKKYENIIIPMFIYFINSLLYMAVFIPLKGFKFEDAPLTLTSIKGNAVSGSILLIIGMTFFIKFIINNRACLKNIDKGMNIEV